MPETADETLQRTQAGAPLGSGNLALVVCGRDGPRFVPLPEDGELVVGRHESCHLSLRDPALSRYHARFARRAGTVIVEDLGSRHGTWLGGKRVEKAELGVGAAVQLAQVLVALTVDSGIEAPASTRALVPEARYLGARMREVHALLHKLAQASQPVLILGETGTGKEVAARELHLASPRSQGPLRVLNCAAIPAHLIESTLFGHERGAFTGADRARAGVFEEAQGGTLFLDEVGELSPSAQAALLRVLETSRLSRVGSCKEIEVDVRIVAATHRDLQGMAARGEFRLDLLHRLCVLSIELPPLRERREEIAALAEHFLAQTGVAVELDAQALALLEQHAWPGNVRELRNVVARAAVLKQGPRVTVNDLPETLRQPGRGRSAPSVTRPAPVDPALGPLRSQLRAVEHDEVRRALAWSGGNQRRAAELLGLSLRTFERRLRAMREAEGRAAGSSSPDTTF